MILKVNRNASFITNNESARQPRGLARGYSKWNDLLRANQNGGQKLESCNLPGQDRKKVEADKLPSRNGLRHASATRQRGDMRHLNRNQATQDNVGNPDVMASPMPRHRLGEINGRYSSAKRNNHRPGYVRGLQHRAPMLFSAAVIALSTSSAFGTSQVQSASVPAQIDLLPKTTATGTILAFDAAMDSAGNVHVAWKNSDQNLFRTALESRTHKWLDAQPMGRGARSIRVVTLSGAPSLFFSTGSDLHAIPMLPHSAGTLPEAGKTIQAGEFIVSFSVCGTESSAFAACVLGQPGSRISLYRLNTVDGKVMARNDFPMPAGGGSLREPEIAACCTDKTVRLGLRQANASLAYCEVDLETLASSGWTSVPLRFSSSPAARATDANIILENTLSIAPFLEGCVLSFTSAEPILLYRDAAGIWSDVLLLAPAGAGPANGPAVAVMSDSATGFVAWIDAARQKKSLNIALPWSDNNPWWGNNDIQWKSFPASPNAGALAARLSAATSQYATNPLGFARAIKAVHSPSIPGVHLLWLGTDMVAKALPKGRTAAHGIFHILLNP